MKMIYSPSGQGKPKQGSKADEAKYQAAKKAKAKPGKPKGHG